MSLELAAVNQYLSASDYKTLFIEELGWDRFKGTLAVTVDQETFTLTGIAHKRGAQVFQCECSSYGSIPATTTRRVIQYEVRQIAHHNLIIYPDAAAVTSLWQWAEWHLNERTPRVYEYSAATSNTANLIERLGLIAFTLEDEETLNILDVANRLKDAFGDTQNRRLRGRHYRAGLGAYDLKEMDAGIRYWWKKVLDEPHLTKEKEYRVACAMNKGDAQAADLLIKSHLHLVARIAWRVATKYECCLDDYFDLVQTGNAELLRITPGFNPADGVRFQTFATFRIEKVLLRSLNGEGGLIPIPRYILESVPNIVKHRCLIEDVLMQDHEQPVTENEVIECLASQYGAEVQTVSRALSALDGVLSLDEGQEEDAPYLPVTSYSLLAPFMTQEAVSQMLAVLKPRQREVIQRRFGISPFTEQTLEEIANSFGVTRERIRQIEIRALKALQKHCYLVVPN